MPDAIGRDRVAAPVESQQPEVVITEAHVPRVERLVEVYGAIRKPNSGISFEIPSHAQDDAGVHERRAVPFDGGFYDLRLFDV
jgi:hypothetical protein